MNPIDEKDLEVLKEIQDNNRTILEQQKEIDAKIEQIYKEKEKLQE